MLLLAIAALFGSGEPPDPGFVPVAIGLGLLPALPDIAENSLVRRILLAWTDPKPGYVRLASLCTRLKGPALIVYAFAFCLWAWLVLSIGFPTA
jgi:hypothetical protein